MGETRAAALQAPEQKRDRVAKTDRRASSRVCDVICSIILSIDVIEPIRWCRVGFLVKLGNSCHIDYEFWMNLNERTQII